MKNLNKLFFLAFILFSFTLLLLACDTAPQKKTKQKQKQNQVTKRIIPQKPLTPPDKQAAPVKAEEPKPAPVKTDETKAGPVKVSPPKTVETKTEPEKAPPAETNETKTVQTKQNKPEKNKTKEVAKTKENENENETENKDLAESKNLKIYMEQDKLEINYYVSEGKIDPFLSPFSTKRSVSDEKNKRLNRKLTPLERFDLSQLQLVAVINMQSGKKNVAMVQESSGKGYMVKVGTYIGTNHGRIIEIGNDEIIIKEQIQNFKGEFEAIIKKMKLQKKDNG